MDFISAYASDLSLIELVLSATLLFLFIILISYSLILFRKTYTYQKKNINSNVDDNKLPGISVIITSKNDSEEDQPSINDVINQNPKVNKVSNKKIIMYVSIAIILLIVIIFVVRAIMIGKVKRKAMKWK